MLGNRKQGISHPSTGSGPNGESATNNQKGFTLLEMVVVVALFTILGTIIINAFLLNLRAQRQVTARQTITSDIRFVMESIARQIRVSEVNYAAYSNPSMPIQSLSLNENGSLVEYRLDSSTNPARIVVNVDGLETALTDPNQVEILNLDFYLSPTTDPFSEERCRDDLDCSISSSCTIQNPAADPFGFCNCSNHSDCNVTQYCDNGFCLPIDEQPKVTIVLGFKSRAVRVEEQKEIFLQSTVSSRVYRR